MDELLGVGVNEKPNRNPKTTPKVISNDTFDPKRIHFMYHKDLTAKGRFRAKAGTLFPP